MARTMDIDEAIAEVKGVLATKHTFRAIGKLGLDLDRLREIKRSLENNDGSTYDTIDGSGEKITYTMKKETTMERRVFTYKDVEEARKYIGKRGVFSNTLSEVHRGIGESGILKAVDIYEYHFQRAEGKMWQFFSPDPEPVEKWVPFPREEWPSLLGRAVLRKEDGFGCLIDTFGSSAFGLSSGDNIAPTAQDLLDRYTFIDGTSCGKKVVE